MFTLFWFICNLGFEDIPWLVNTLIYSCFFAVDFEIGYGLYKKYWKIGDKHER